MKHSTLPYKKYLLITTITLFAVSAFLGITFILVGADETAWKITGTVAILALLSLMSMNNIFRLESKNRPVRVLSTVALVSNVFWSVPWILILWSVFRTLLCGEPVYSIYSYVTCSDGYYDFMSVIYKVTITAGIVSATVTIIANLLNTKNYSTAISILKISAISSAIFLGVYFLPALWFEEGDYIGDTWRLFAVVGIIFAFSSIVTPILAKIAKSKASKETAPKEQPVDEALLRKEIEAEVRAKIAAEEASKNSDR